jgi:hypothetical protein
MRDFSGPSDLRPEEIRAKVDAVLIAADPTWGWSVRVLAGQTGATVLSSSGVASSL